MSITRTSYIAKDTWIARNVSGTTNYGNGITTKITVGPAASGTATYKGRGLFQVPLDFSGMSVLTAASAYFEVADEVCAVRGSTQEIFLERLASGFDLNTATGNCVVATSGTAAAKWPGPTADTANRALYSGSGLSTGDVISFDILAMLQAAMDRGDTVLRFRLIAANAAGDGYAEENTARTLTLKSSKSGSGPSIEYTGDSIDAGAKAMSLSIGVSLSMSVSTGGGTIASAFSVDGAEGVIVLSQQNDKATAILDGVSVQDVVTSCQFSYDKIPAGGYGVLRLLTRAVDDANYYAASFRTSASGVMELHVHKAVAGVLTVLAANTSIGNFVAGAVYNIEISAVGATPTALMARVWRDGTTIPDWQLLPSDSEAGLQVAASVGVAVEVTTLTNLPLTYKVDEFVAVAP